MQSTRLAPFSSAAVRAARRCALAAAVATSLVAASCGDDSPTVERSGDDASGTTTTAPTTTAPATDSTAPTESTSPDGPAAGQRFRVTIKDMAYTPNPVTVKPGVIVTWTNLDSTTHTVTADNGEFDGELTRARGFGRAFNTPGTFAYHCKIHPSMKGTITVQ